MPKRGVKIWRPDCTVGLCPAPRFCINHMEREYYWPTDHTDNCILYIFTMSVKYCFPVKILQRISFWNLQNWNVIECAVIFHMSTQNAIICGGCELKFTAGKYQLHTNDTYILCPYRSWFLFLLFIFIIFQCHISEFAKCGHSEILHQGSR